MQTENWGRPLYWLQQDDGWYEFTLYGLRRLDPEAPLAHISYFEADAFARWNGCRLPTEFEWEHAATKLSMSGQFSDEGTFHAAWPHEEHNGHDAGKVGADERSRSALTALFGTSWEWTCSHYSPYPGYKPVDGALGEYNGKFMSNQFVLKGGSCATHPDHISEIDMELRGAGGTAGKVQPECRVSLSGPIRVLTLRNPVSGTGDWLPIGELQPKTRGRPMR